MTDIEAIEDIRNFYAGNEYVMRQEAQINDFREQCMRENPDYIAMVHADKPAHKPNRFQKIIERSGEWERAERDFGAEEDDPIRPECNFSPEYLAVKHDENIREEIRRANTGATPSQAPDQTGGGSPIATPAGLPDGCDSFWDDLGLGGMK